MRLKPQKFLLMALIFFIFGLFCSISFPQRLVVVEKCSRTLYLYENGTFLKAFPVSLGFDPVSPKQKAGDGATPEGLYYVTDKHRSRKYYLFVGISYPNLKDISLARWEGRLSLSSWQNCLSRNGLCPLGNNVGIHGGGVLKDGLRDWTHGCVALNNEDMQKVYQFTEIGTPVLIFDAQKPLFETLKQLVLFPAESSELWQGKWEFSLPGYLLKVSLWEDYRGRRELTFVGYQPQSGKVLFWFKDRNGDGALEFWEPQRCYGLCEDYSEIKNMILDVLPRWVENQELGRGG